MSFDRTIARLIDHTILKPEATRVEIRQVCSEALRYEFASVCVNPFWVPFVAVELRGSPVKVCTVVDFRWARPVPRPRSRRLNWRSAPAPGRSIW